MYTKCEICGSPAVDVREPLSFQGVPLGVFEVRKCLGVCKEEVFPHDAWRAMEAIERTLEATRNPLMSTTNALTFGTLEQVSIDTSSLNLGAPIPIGFAGEPSATVQRLAVARLLESSY
jgi:hypothetical protein